MKFFVFLFFEFSSHRIQRVIYAIKKYWKLLNGYATNTNEVRNFDTKKYGVEKKPEFLHANKDRNQIQSGVLYQHQLLFQVEY